jgi:hypothetical protein
VADENVANPKLSLILFFARYEAGCAASPRIGLEHLLLGLLREPAIRSILGSPNAAHGIRSRVEKSLPPAERPRPGLEAPLQPEVVELVDAADKRYDRTDPAALKYLFVSIIRRKPEWFEEFGVDAEKIDVPVPEFPFRPPTAKMPAHRLKQQPKLLSELPEQVTDYITFTDVVVDQDLSTYLEPDAALCGPGHLHTVTVTRGADGYHLTIPAKASGINPRLFFKPTTITDYSRLIPVVDIREEV